MQTLSWYIARLRSMSPREVLLRVHAAGRDRADRLMLTRRQRPRKLAEILLDGSAGAAARGFHLPVLASSRPGAPLPCESWRNRLVAGADAIVAHRLSFFDVQDRFLGDPIDWNRDHAAGVAAPMIYAPAIDYRDFAITGDCKNVWEPSRHHHLVTLGRAYWATGRQEYAQEAAAQLESWLEQCPYGVGMQWRSGLELGVRLINWVWLMELIAPSGAIAGSLAERLLDSIDRHLWEIARKYSYGSSANNHLVGEAAGVYIAARYFSGLRRSGRLVADARRRLIEQMAAQTNADGGDKEQALGYHLFVAQFFLVAGLVGRWSGDEFPTAYWQRLEKMFEFLAVLGQGGRQWPMFGDSDDGHALDLGGGANDYRGWLAAAGVMFNREDFAAVAGEPSQVTFWLLDATGPARAGSPSAQPRAAVPHGLALTSKALPDTGYYLLQGGAGQTSVSAIFDCGALGLGSLAGHGHADALSLVLRLGGEDVLVDPGTYDYFTYPQWRQYFRSTRAHNTVEVDGQNQSEIQGLFLWGRKAKAHCIAWQPGDQGGQVVGEHDGYTRLADPVTHRRSVNLDVAACGLEIRDELRCRGAHEATIWFHFAEGCRLLEQAGSMLKIQAGSLIVELALDERLAVQTCQGSPGDMAGWVSRGYHLIEPAFSIMGRCRLGGDETFVCTLKWRVLQDGAIFRTGSQSQCL